MKADYLKLTAYVAYLGSWILFLIGGIVLSIPLVERAMQPRRVAKKPRDPRGLAGLALQFAAAVATTLMIPKGPLPVGAVGQALVLVLAPASALLFCLTAGIARRADPEELVMHGPYSVVRHPLYLSIYGMLAATTLLMASPLAFVVATALFVAGTELRVAAEERELEDRFSEAFREYRRRVPAMYLPPLR
jgi:protein-S-isoprenylcysteine O-methyltransferase Ste14